MYTPPDQVIDQIYPLVDDIKASSQLFDISNGGRPRFFVNIISKKPGLAQSFGPLFEVPKVLSYSPTLGRNIKVRIYISITTRRRVVRTGFKPYFRVLSPGRVEITQDVASVLNLKVRKLLPVKNSGTRRRKSLLPRPNESIVENRPLYKWDGSTFTLYDTFNVVTHLRTWSGSRTADYARLKAKGQLPINPHHVLLQDVRDFGNFFQEAWLDLPGYGTGTFEPYSYRLGTSDHGPTVNIAHDYSRRNVAISRLRDKALGESANLAEDFATANLTFRMIGDTIMRIAKAYRNVKTGNLPAALSTLYGTTKPHRRPNFSRSTANNWLELQYGWKPLLNDVDFAIKSISKLDLVQASIVSVSSSATIKKEDGGVLRPNSGPNPPVVGSWKSKLSTTTKIGVRFKIADQLRSFLSQSGFTNPVSLAWELLPFSFVVDWFLPVGSYLESIDSWNGLEFMEGYETTFTRLEVAYHRAYSGYDYPGGHQNPPTRFTQLEGGLHKSSILLDRAKLSAFPSMSLPLFKNPLSVGHALNALALLRQYFGK